MTPADPSAAAVHEAADCSAVEAPSQRKQPRRNRRAERPRPEDKSALLEWAYCEYQRLREEGQKPNISQWCADFPTCRSALRQVLDVEAYTASYLDRDAPKSEDVSIDWPCVGEQRADFTILRELGRGALARVYLATEGSTGGRLVVLKCSLYGDAEARTLGRLMHPHIVPLLSARRDERSGLTLMCMPYLGCATLEDVLDRLANPELSPPSNASFVLDVIRSRAQSEDPPMSGDTCLLRGSYTDGVIYLAVQLAQTLAFLHQNGVAHRDLKPSNVLLHPSGKPLLLDFNLSESEREAAVFVGGTLRYMAPEQIRAFLSKRRDGMDERVDFYALGVMVYELLGGVPPCASLLEEPYQPSQAEALLLDLQVGFRPFREICPQLERPVAAILDRCVALDASKRPSNAAELAAALKQQFTPVRRLRRRCAAHRRWLLAALGLLLLAVAVLAHAWAVTAPYSQRVYERGRIAYLAGDFEAAERHFDQALRAEPNNTRFRRGRGCARLQQSKYQPPDQEKFDQIASDLTFTERGAADERTLAVRAYLDLRNQKYTQAIQKYDQILRLGYRPIMALNNRAYGYFYTGQLREAQIDLEEAVQVASRRDQNPPQAVHYNRALVALQMRWRGTIPTIPLQALEDVEQALQLGPKTSALYRDAAILYARAADEDPRHSHFERALFYLRQAITAGERPAKFGPSPSLSEALRGPKFVTLLGSQPPPSSHQPDLRLIDPIDLAD